MESTGSGIDFVVFSVDSGGSGVDFGGFALLSGGFGGESNQLDSVQTEMDSLLIVGTPC